MAGQARCTLDGLSGHIVGVRVRVRWASSKRRRIRWVDGLGRGCGIRIEEKLRIVEETRAKGASVAAVARRHHVNPNQVFAWRRQHRSGLLNAQGAKGDAKMLLVTNLNLISIWSVRGRDGMGLATQNPVLFARRIR
jgi:hypothetical protein